MKMITSFALVAVFGLLVSCGTISPHPMDMTQAVQSAKTRADHEALAKHYEDAAKEMQVKVEEHKQLIARYEAVANIPVYRPYITSFRNPHQALARIYEQAVAENMSMAKTHRQMAAEAK